MLLPFAEKAYIDDQKLVGYCLLESHITGKHKARVFKAALGITATDFLVLREAVLTAVLLNEAQFVDSNQKGDLYSVDFIMKYNSQKANVRTAWIIRHSELFPRLVSCYVNN